MNTVPEWAFEFHGHRCPFRGATMEKTNHNTNSMSATRKVTFPDGFRVGIQNLDDILKEVADLKLTDPNSIKKELVERVKAYNYVASSAENEYSTVLYREYQRKFEPDKFKGERTERHQHTKG